MNLKKEIKSSLSKLKFALGYNPEIEKKEDRRRFIPEGYSAVLTITADFELAWAPRYNNSMPAPYDYALTLARQERKNLPEILAICDVYDIPITWATVGHLFLESCTATATQGKHPEIPQIKAYQGPYWDFHGGDWFEYDPCTGLEEHPEWYAPDLIRQIRTAKAGHEIGCHTFSHIDCRDGVCSPEVLEAELRRCRELAEEVGIDMTSFVHPGHTIGNLDVLSDQRFTSFQSDPGNVLGYPIQHPNGLWELKRTMEWVRRPEWNLDYHMYRYSKIIDRAIDHEAVCNFWFHPSFDPYFIEGVLPGLFAHIRERSDRIWIGTVGEYVQFLNTVS